MFQMKARWVGLSEESKIFLDRLATLPDVGNWKKINKKTKSKDSSCFCCICFLKFYKPCNKWNAALLINGDAR